MNEKKSRIYEWQNFKQKWSQFKVWNVSIFIICHLKVLIVELFIDLSTYVNAFV